MAKTVTGHDVARLAGVSQATVSRALRNLPGTSPRTRAAVLAAAEALNYLPSDSGRALSTRRTRRVAVVVAELTNPYYPELVEPLRQALLAHDLRTVLVSDRPERSDHGALVDQLADGSYDSVILTTTTRDSTLPRDLTEREVPHVLVNRVLDHPESPGCTFDNVDGSAQVARLLAGLGHRAIGAILGPVDTSTGRDRASGLQDALRTLGRPLTRRFTRRVSAFEHDTAFRSAHELLSMNPRPTAIVCANDVVALGALSAARKLNLAVPSEVTVVGFDDIAMAAWPLVDLTTVRCDLHVLALRSVELITGRLSGASREDALVRVPVELIERGTHAPPPRDARDQ
ncbi:LacI family DNA-binding transcriptional regulator [Actinomadura madurae]|uniref:LacI family DNA-binding transcriptional regulator n=1 Tax=Actinomadura madurae TaxID=1993 RepID=UPI002025E1DF|nr:LacI family DNA-binding transcriptional regulator [Actinomadura madurae]URM96526.1 LacI family DNA-binding transcriptional regulator [Actinomadura madurae]